MIKSKPNISGRLYPASASLVVDTDKRPGLWDTLQNDPEFWRFDDSSDRLDIKAILFDISDNTADMMKTFIDGSISDELFENHTFEINDGFKIKLQIDLVEDNKVSLVVFLIGDYNKYIIHKEEKSMTDKEKLWDLVYNAIDSSYKMCIERSGVTHRQEIAGKALHRVALDKAKEFYNTIDDFETFKLEITKLMKMHSLVTMMIAEVEKNSENDQDPDLEELISGILADAALGIFGSTSNIHLLATSGKEDS